MVQKLQRSLAHGRVLVLGRVIAHLVGKVKHTAAIERVRGRVPLRMAVQDMRLRELAAWRNAFWQAETRGGFIGAQIAPAGRDVEARKERGASGCRPGSIVFGLAASNHTGRRENCGQGGHTDCLHGELNFHFNCIQWRELNAGREDRREITRR